MVRKLNSNSISVIIQGAIEYGITRRCLKSIRKFLPDAEIILSSWEGAKLDGLEGLYDIAVLNKDPSAVIFDDSDKRLNNLNRILVSSKNGIAKASRKYVLRLRSDLELKNDNILKLKDDLPERNPAASLFRQRIFAYEIFSIKYDTKKRIRQRMLFHISDWCYFGLKEDLQEFFNLPQVKEPDFSRYFENQPKSENDIHQTRLWKMSPEQYFTSSNAAKVFKNLKFDNYLDITPENVGISEDFIINNFRVFSQKEWGISTLKKEYKDIKMYINSPFVYYSKIEQLHDYKKYCNISAIIKESEFTKKMYNIQYYDALRKHFFRLLYGRLAKKFAEFFSVVFYFYLFLSALIKELLCRKK